MNDYAFAVQCPQCGQDIRAGREGDDLLLTAGGPQNGLRLQDYYLGGQDWQLRTAGGQTQSVADLLAAPTTDRLQQAWQDYRANFKSGFYSGIAYGGSGARVDACFARKAKVRAFTAGRHA